MTLIRISNRLQVLKKRIIEWLSIILLAAIIIIPLSMLVWLTFFTDTFTIQAITVVDAREHTIETVRVLLEPQKGKNIFFIQSRVIEQRIASTIPQLRDVHIVRKLPGTLKVILQEKQPAVLLLSTRKYYFVDQNGIPYEEARLDTLPGTVLPVVKNNDQGTSVSLGVPALDISFINLIVEAQKEVPSIIQAHIAEMRIPSLAAREVHFYLSNNWILKLDTTRPLEVQMHALKRLLEHTIPAEDRPNMEYIDLRIPNRVYYKLRPTQ